MHSCCLTGHQAILTKLSGVRSRSETRQRGKETEETAKGEGGAYEKQQKIKKKAALVRLLSLDRLD